ncbi:glycosyltransferase [Turicibacter sanguinis]|uniref:glycosyltransferase n=1 Tax=Turicibacter sanguinis TaxID=154288 RepID=UPI0018A90810|nr:glycosyltransferase [Turicibacter sanguinis]MDB8558414.1 glycosyltransferase [Turicibacter sanguinis]MDB8561210.1 glycosyltransferase [Turicibacter sanguinis]
MCTLSIIVPVYNVESYLKRCLDSILAQTFQDFQLIIINDGSTDCSGQICNSYAKNNEKVIVIHQENQGLSAARNKGLSCAIGDYIGFVDSDDFILETMYEIMIKEAFYYDADIVSANYLKHDNQILKSDKKKGPLKFYNNIEALNNYLLDFDDKERKIDTVVWNKIYKRNLFKDIRFPVGKIYEDGYVTYKLLYYAHKTIHIDKVLYFYSQRDGSISKSKFSERDATAYDDWKDIYRFIYKNANSLSNLVAPKYIKKNVLLYQKIKNSNISCKNIYLDKIYVDLKEDYISLMKLKINIFLKIRLSFFLLHHFFKIDRF